jgi:hypothetical protein
LAAAVKDAVASFQTEILRLPEQMNTAPARELAGKCAAFVAGYFQMFIKEIGQELA